MLFGIQDTVRREDTQPTDPTTMEQAAPVPKALHVPFETDHKGSPSGNLNVLSTGRTISRKYIKDRTYDLLKVDHLSQASATPMARVHGREGGSVRTPPNTQFATSRRPERGTLPRPQGLPDPCSQTADNVVHDSGLRSEKG